MAEQHNIPPGYRRNTQGHLVPEGAISDIDKSRDDLVRDIVAAAKDVRGILSRFKSRTMGDISAFADLSAEKYGAQLGGKKGNISLLSFDGKYKVQVAVAERYHFDERLQAAKALVDQCIQDWTADSATEVKALVDQAFQVDKEGQINIGRLVMLRRLEIKDPRWTSAMQAISDSMQVASTTSYIRVYERVGETNKYEQVTLDVARV